jgi:hypothetical protein
MEGILVTDDELKLLEKKFGPTVRDMGAWNSDGTFGYSWISLAVVEKAAESITDPDLQTALSRLVSVSDPKQSFLTLLEMFGHSAIDRIVHVHRQHSLERTFEPAVVDRRLDSNH